MFVHKAAVNAGFTTRGRNLATLTGIYTSVLKLFCRYVIPQTSPKPYTVTWHASLEMQSADTVIGYCDL